jgi:GT2 family glycosyltransferase
MKSLFELYGAHQGKVSDKWSIYLAEYNRLFSGFREQFVRMLEIGIQNGGSLEIWSKYFPNAQILVGCDINPDCAKLAYDDPRIQLVIGDANTDAVEKRILSHSTNFDLIIDDGSHTSGDIAKSFGRYFRHLNEGGLFIAEDLHCSYWCEFEGGLYYPYSSMAFFKRLADVVNHEHWGIAKARGQLLRGFSEKFSIEFDESELANIHSIEFFNSVCVVRKRQAKSNVLGERFIAGQHEFVVPGHHRLSGTSQAPSQASNEWSVMMQAPEEAWKQLRVKLSNRDSQITSLNQALTERDSQVAAMLQSTSWRIMAPYRMLGHQVKRIRHLWRLLPSVLRHGGGVKATIVKVSSICRYEGLAGIRGRLISIQTAATSHAPVTLPNGQQVGRNDYREWIRRYDTIDDEMRNRIRAHIADMKHSTLISVIMPTYNAKPEWLCEAIESVQKQLYPNWELCIADDASTDPAIRPLLERFATEDARIKVVFREKNGHISAASNSALELASGDWVALLDHDDLLSENALFWVVQLLHNRPDVRMVYSDEDKINKNGVRTDPYFKCDWNPDLFYSHNMFSHLGVYHLGLVRSVGGFRAGFEGSQDHDLALRCIEQIKPDQVAHIPRVLYHWRVHAESTASGADAKPYAILAGEQALNEHFQRMGIKGRVEFIGFGYRARYQLPIPAPLVSLLIPTRDHKVITEVAVRSILEKTTYSNYEIIILDNSSTELETLKWFERIQQEYERVRVIRYDHPFNYSAINNFGVTQARGSIVGLINNDVEVITPDWLSEMVSHALREDIGCVGAKLYYSNDTLQHGGIILGIGDVAGHSHRHFPRGAPGYIGRAMLTQSFSAVTAACLLVRKKIFEAVGGLDEKNLRIEYNDVDFCLKVREAGYRNLWTPYSELYHHESISRGLDDTPEKQARSQQEIQSMKSRWGQKLIQDPYYSPNLTQRFEDFSLAWPPRVEFI